MNIKIPTPLQKAIHEDMDRALVITYLKVLNALNTNVSSLLTANETIILTEFLLLPSKYRYYRFSKHAKPKVVEALREKHGMEKMGVLNLNNYISALVKKGYIWRDEDGVKYIKKAILLGVKEVLDSKSLNLVFDA